MKNILIFICFFAITQTAIARRPLPQRFVTINLVLQGKLHGTLVTPRNGGNFPLVVIVPGSGPTDRNGNNEMGLQTDCYKKLADSLAMNGIASFRFDKRGVAQSADSTMKEEELIFETYILDTKAWITELKKSDYSFTKIILAGHSEGSLIAMCAMTDADAYISIAGISEGAATTLKTQLKGKLGALEPLVYKQLDSLQNGNSVTCTNPMLMSILRPSVQPYMKSWFAYTPTKILAGIKKPCLLLQGTKDMQVATKNATALKKANPKAQLVVIKNMNHVLVNVKSDEENTNSYNDVSLPLHADVIKSMVTFCKKIK
jgi:uncharacterized protein